MEKLRKEPNQRANGIGFQNRRKTMIYKSDAIAVVNKEIQKQKYICRDILDAPGWRIYEKAMGLANDAIRALPERKEK